MKELKYLLKTVLGCRSLSVPISTRTPDTRGGPDTGSRGAPETRDLAWSSNWSAGVRSLESTRGERPVFHRRGTVLEGRNRVRTGPRTGSPLFLTHVSRYLTHGVRKKEPWVRCRRNSVKGDFYQKVKSTLSLCKQETTYSLTVVPLELFKDLLPRFFPIKIFGLEHSCRDYTSLSQ